MRRRTRSNWGWGYVDELPSRAELLDLAGLARRELGFGGESIEEPVPIEDVQAAAPRIAAPPALTHLCVSDKAERVRHAHGQAYRDIVRSFRGEYRNIPDLVAYPTSEADIVALLDWCAAGGAAVIPYGGGTSVVGGIEPRFPQPAVTIDLTRMDQVLEIDSVSGAATIESGASGPEINQQLAGHGMQLRHFPQSYELSTLGGWIATHAGGHYATGRTRIDDLVESVRAVTPDGIWESLRLPGSGAGISPDRMLLGSEGCLGVITRAAIRVQRRPAHRSSTGVRFAGFAAGAAAVRDIVQADLYPSNCRLIDPTEAALVAGGDGSHALLLLGFESADHPVDTQLERALQVCADHGGTWDEIRDGRKGQAGAWRTSFTRAPYLRNVLVSVGVISETFETAVTWDRAAQLDQAVLMAVSSAVARVCGSGTVTRRITFAYPDGAALYYTVLAPGRQGSELAQWDEIKAIATDAIVSAGGTITHNHAVGRDHMPWYVAQRPAPFASALRGMKAAIDPATIMNPGVLLNIDDAAANS